MNQIRSAPTLLSLRPFSPLPTRRVGLIELYPRTLLYKGSISAIYLLFGMFRNGCDLAEKCFYGKFLIVSEKDVTNLPGYFLLWIQ